MDEETKLKWVFNQKLTHEEMMSVIVELFGGADAEYVYQPNVAINHKLFNMYSQFPKTKNSSNFKVYFSDQEIDKRPLIMMEQVFQNNSPTHRLQTDDFNVVVFETPKTDCQN